jgi:hypothetical protein
MNHKPCPYIKKAHFSKVEEKKEVKGKDPPSIIHPSIQIWDGKKSPKNIFSYCPGRENFGHEQ